MRHRVAAISGIQKEAARLTIVVRLSHDLAEQLARFDRFIDANRESGDFGLLQRSVKPTAGRVAYIEEAQVPFSVVTHRAHKRISDANRNVEVGDGVLVSLAGDEIFDIGMVAAQYGHVSAAARSPLGDLAEGLIVNT